MFCPQCGTEMEEHENTCPKCGVKRNEMYAYANIICENENRSGTKNNWQTAIGIAKIVILYCLSLVPGFNWISLIILSVKPMQTTDFVCGVIYGCISMFSIIMEVSNNVLIILFISTYLICCTQSFKSLAKRKKCFIAPNSFIPKDSSQRPCFHREQDTNFKPGYIPEQNLQMFNKVYTEMQQTLRDFKESNDSLMQKFQEKENVDSTRQECIVNLLYEIREQLSVNSTEQMDNVIQKLSECIQQTAGNLKESNARLIQKIDNKEQADIEQQEHLSNEINMIKTWLRSAKEEMQTSLQTVSSDKQVNESQSEEKHTSDNNLNSPIKSISLNPQELERLRKESKVVRMSLDESEDADDSPLEIKPEVQEYSPIAAFYNRLSSFQKDVLAIILSQSNPLPAVKKIIQEQEPYLLPAMVISQINDIATDIIDEVVIDTSVDDEHIHVLESYREELILLEKERHK